jgi:transposase InsO family protein
MPLLHHLDQATGLPVRRPRPIRYERARPGELVHVDIKKLGRIPNGGGHRALGRAKAVKNNNGHGTTGRGYSFLHHAIDDHSRLAYSEILNDEKKETAAAFWRRATQFFNTAGITVTAVMTDNGACYRSRDFHDALGDANHIWTRPYRPQTNGKVERFNRTLATEWAYANTYLSDEARAATYDAWLHNYNHHRPHTGIGGQVPSDRVHNLTGNYN